MQSFAFFLSAVIAGAVAFMLLPAGMAQIGAWAICLLFVALFAFSLVRKTNRPWRQPGDAPNRGGDLQFRG